MEYAARPELNFFRQANIVVEKRGESGIEKDSIPHS